MKTQLMYTTTSQQPAPKLAVGPKCPQCAEGVLRRIASTQSPGFFWGCDHFKSAGCRATFRDEDGAPSLAAPSSSPGQKCPECKDGHLRRIARKEGTGFFWGCDHFKSNGCKATFKDKAGAPDLVVQNLPSSNEKQNSNANEQPN